MAHQLDNGYLMCELNDRSLQQQEWTRFVRIRALRRHHLHGSLCDLADGRKVELLESLRRWNRHKGDCQSIHRRFQVTQVLCGQSCNDFGTDSKGFVRLLYNEEPAGLEYRCCDGVRIQRADAAKIDDLGGDSLGGKLYGRLQSEFGGIGVTHERQVSARSGQEGFAWLPYFSWGYWRTVTEQHFVFEEDRWCTTPYCTFEKSGGVGRSCRCEHVQTWHMCEERFETLRVMGPHAKSCAREGADHHRQRRALTAEHPSQFCQLIHNRIEASQHEI